jgi:hypothetical protein
MATTPKYRAENHIGIPSLWLFTRMSQLLWLIITLKAIHGVRGDQNFFEKSFSFGVIFVVLSVVLHSFSDGWVDSGGVHFRRYFRYKTKRWEDIEAIQWVGFRLVTKVRGKGLLNGSLSFWLDPFEAIKQYRMQESGGELEPPAILMLIVALPVDSPPKVVQGPLTNSLISFAFFAGFGGAFLIALVGLLYRIVQGR